MARGQILRVSAALQVLFDLESDLQLHSSASISHVSEDAILAAIDFVDVCCKHTAYMAGRGIISEEITTYTSGMYTYNNTVKVNM